MVPLIGILWVIGLLFFVRLAVVCVYISQQVVHVLLGEGRLVVVIVEFEEHGEHVGYGLALRIAHDVDGGIDTFGHQLVLQQITAAVATDDAAHFPEAEVVEEFSARDANLAHEQLVDVVGVA